METLPLKDIHLPAQISGWPPALGWVLAPMLLVVLLVAGYYLYRRLTRKTAVKSAERLLKTLRQQPREDNLATLTELSALLRRTAISQDGRDKAAGLSGQAWLEYLDQGLADTPFSSGVGRCLADGHYRPTVGDVDVESLFALCERWLKQQRKKTC